MPAPFLRLAAAAALGALPFAAHAAVVSSVAGGTLTATSDAGDAITIACGAGAVQVNGANPGTGPATCASIQAIVVQGGPGANVLSLASVSTVDFTALTARTMAAGAGNDTLLGSPGPDTLVGDGDIDLVDGNGGNDIVSLGAGDDTFVWNPGDGSDVVDGDGGTDLLQFDGSAVGETIALAANGARATLTRNVGAIVMDIGTVEQVRINALGGQDTVTLNDLAGTGVASATFDLGGVLGSSGGDAAVDAVVLNGSTGADALTVTASGVQVLVSGGPVALMLDDTEAANDTLAVNSLAGNDSAVVTGNLAALLRLTLDGGDDDDTLSGGNGVDTMLGGNGNDTIDGNQANDVAFLGGGNDFFDWQPGDGSDVVEGQAGSDTLRFFGSAAAEVFAVGANGARVLFTRNIGNIVMDLDDVEAIELAASAGADAVTANDPIGTDLSSLAIDLGGADAAADVVTVNGSASAESFALFGTPAQVSIARATSTTTVAGAEPANDRLAVNGLAGNDTLFVATSLAGAMQQLAFDGGTEIDAARAQGGSPVVDEALRAQPSVVAGGVDALVGGTLLFTATTIESLLLEGGGGNDTFTASPVAGVELTMAGGPGDDTLTGGLGAQTLLGGDGNDSVNGGDGNDIAFLGADDDTFVWNPGDDNDTVEGQGGIDTLLFNGSNVAETIGISPNGGRVLFTRDVAAVTMDLDDVETLRFNAFGGADNVTVNDLGGTDLAAVDVDLRAAGGGGDGAVDNVVAAGSAANDVFAASIVRGGIGIARLALTVTALGAEAANDVALVAGLGGDDVLAGDVAAAALVQRLTFDGGAAAGLGDQLIVSGADVAEAWTIAPNMARLSVTRAAGGFFDGASIERLQLAANGGADTVNTQGFAAIAQTLDGGAPASFPGDVLAVSGFAGDPSVSPILIGGAQPIAHAGFEFGPTGGRVRGRTYDDLDRDGLSDAGEPALAGLTVYDDANANRIVDVGEASSVTAADGSYELAFPDEGSTVDVRVVRPTDRVQTNADPATIVLSGDTTVANIDFGFTPGTLIEAFPTGWQETPPNASPGTGYGYAALYEPSNEAVFVLSYSGLGSANTLSHVHGPAARGVAASPIISLPASGATSGSFRVGPMVLSAGQVAELKAGLWYYNLHTTTFPGGEIRGQLDNALFRDSFE